MHCRKCGKEIEKDWAYCLFCGDKIFTEERKNKNLNDENPLIKLDEKSIFEETNKAITIKEDSNANNDFIRLIKFKNLFIIFLTFFSIFFILLLVTSLLFYNSNKENNVLQSKFLQLQDSNSSLIKEHDTLNTNYNELQIKFDKLPKDSGEFSELTGRIEETYEVLYDQINYIHFLKCINSYDLYTQKLNEYHVKTQEEIIKNYDEYWNKVVKNEQDYRNSCINLERKLANAQISYETYSNSWDLEFNKYDNNSKKAFTDYQNKINPIIEEYDKQIATDYDNHVKSINEADQELNQSTNELLEKIRELYQYYEINMPNNGWLLSDDLETFGFKELSDKYQEEIDELYYK